MPQVHTLVFRYRHGFSKAWRFLSITQADSEQNKLSKGTIAAKGLRLVEWREDYRLATGDHRSKAGKWRLKSALEFTYFHKCH